MKKLLAFFKLIRWFHELLAIFPFVALYFIIRYFATIKNLAPSDSINGFQFTLVCLGVVMLMIPGFILNDIADHGIDQINKPGRHVVGRIFSIRTSWTLFVIFSLLLVVLSVTISLTFFHDWAWISLIVYSLSLMYDLKLKQSPLIGNITIAFLGSAIPLVILLFARKSFNALQMPQLETLVWMYAGFPFLIIIPRELSLDISDMEGDKACGCRTLPILIGEKKSKHLVSFFIVFTIAVSVFIMIKLAYLRPVAIVISLMLVIYILWLYRCKTRIDYIRAGRFLWFILIAGTIALTIATLMR